MKKRKLQNGFTLIELLGIILILAVIAVITVPIVNNVIEQSKKGAAIDSAYGYMKSVNDFYTKKIYEDSDFEFDDATYLIIDLKDLGLNVTGAQPTDDSWVEMENNEVKRFSLRYGEYVVNYDINTNKVVAFKGDIDENANSQEFKSLLASISNYLEQLPRNSTIKNSKEDIVFKLNAVPAPPAKPAGADDNSWVKFVYENNKIKLKDYSIKINEYVFDYNPFAENKIGVTKNGTLRERPLSPISIAGTLKEDGKKYYTTPQTIYFNPKSNNANCEPGTTDCMKWYAYSENPDGTVNMILDHNTTQNTPWVSATDYSGTSTTQIETLGITYPKTKTESNPLGINGQDNWNYKDNGSSLSSPGNWNKGPITLLNKLRQDTEYWSSSIIKRNSYGNYVNKNKYYNSSDCNYSD